MNRILLPVLLAGLLGTGLAHAATAPHVTASHAWIRVLPGNLPAGAYVVLHNDGDQPVSLTGASSPAYGEAMLHESSGAGGMNRMAMVDALTIPAHGTQALQPGGYHLMLMDAKHPVQPGDTVRVVLKFGDGGTLPVDFTARPANALDDGK
ncbi:copper chaperone PCu(A)C [Dyella agri]|uniref:Copper chaperone PCu(A)C n=1 Tax=Dyella agri TaxID=1926869 RepID=A0ABW8KEE4_9GAMM